MRKSFVTFVGTVVFMLLFTVTAFADSRFVTASVLNIRSAPSTESAVIGQVVTGDELELVEVTDATWAKVQIGERYGYVAREYLTVTREAARLGSRSGKRPVNPGQAVVEYAKEFIMGLDIYLLRKVYIGAGCGSR